MSESMIEALNDYDWHEAFGYAGEEGTCAAGGRISVALGSSCAPSPFSRADVIELRHHRVGENDGANWLACGLLRDGRWFFLEAGCDYTGWDCQASGSAVVADSWDALLLYALTDEARDAFGLGARHGND